MYGQPYRSKKSWHVKTAGDRTPALTVICQGRGFNLKSLAPKAPNKKGPLSPVRVVPEGETTTTASRGLGHGP